MQACQGIRENALYCHSVAPCDWIKPCKGIAKVNSVNDYEIKAFR